MKNKKMVLWIALIVMAIIPVYAQQYDSEKDFQIDWDKNVKDGVIITNYVGAKKEVRIPPSIQNNPVTGIGEQAFRDNENITRVIIPNSVTSIGIGAFYGCESLTSVTIPDSVTSIGGWAFWGCDRLATINVNVGNTAYSLQDGVLYNKNKTTLVAYPPGKTGTVFIIPNGVNSIGNAAFGICKSLTSVTIPDSVTSIGTDAFSLCTSLTSVTIPNSITSIGIGAFMYCTKLTSVTIPNSVTSIGDDAFVKCENLTVVTIQGTITSNNFGSGNPSPFDGDLRDKYLARDGGPGTYRRLVGGDTWKKQ